MAWFYYCRTIDANCLLIIGGLLDVHFNPIYIILINICLLQLNVSEREIEIKKVAAAEEGGLDREIVLKDHDLGGGLDRDREVVDIGRDPGLRINPRRIQGGESHLSTGMYLLLDLNISLLCSIKLCKVFFYCNNCCIYLTK